MRKVLFTATIDKHILRFHLPYLEWFKQKGFEVHVAANGNEVIPFCDVKHVINVERTPFSINNLKAVNQLKQIAQEHYFDLVHCHTAMGGVVTRLAFREARRRGTKVLYTAHGFHFYKGGSFKNWLLYYPVEKWLARFTDGIITINAEDHDLLLDRKFKVKDVFQINGIGVEHSKFKPISADEKSELRKAMGYREKDFILIYAAEFIPRKNHQFIIESMPELKKSIPEVKVLFAGRGKLMEEMRQKATANKVDDSINFLGFRSDIHNLIQLSDVGISSSKQEGLGLNLAEEMFCGLPIVATMDRGHKELVQHDFNGFLFEQNNTGQFTSYILNLYNNPEKRTLFSINALASVQKFSLKCSLESMSKIYMQYL